MKKLFLSQPMRDKTVTEIRTERISIAQEITKNDLLQGDEFFILDTIFTDSPSPETKVIPLFYLGRSIQLLGQADCAYFANGWENYNGCCIEHDICIRYGIPIIKD